MDKQRIYQKYITHVEAVTGGGQWIDWGVLRLALRLAIDEVEEATLALNDGVCAALRTELRAVAEERDFADRLLEEIETWKEKQKAPPALNWAPANTLAGAPSPSTPISASMAPGAPAAGATLPGGESLRQILPLPALSSNGLGTNGSASSVSTPGSGGDGRVDPTPAPYWGADHPAWAGMTEEDVVTLAALESGAMRFGRIDREQRLKLVGRVIGELVDINGKLSMETFDRQRPAWMPQATGLTALVGGKWDALRMLR